MILRKLATALIECTYESIADWKREGELSHELNKHDIPVWNQMSDKTKCEAMEYVYKNRDTIELHSEVVDPWVQATAYFMLYDFVAEIISGGGEPELDVFFDDMDFWTKEDAVTDYDIREQITAACLLSGDKKPDFFESKKVRQKKQTK